jgi:maltose-binding protein MalE
MEAGLMRSRRKAGVIIFIILSMILACCMGCNQETNQSIKITNDKDEQVDITIYPVDEIEVEYITWAIPGKLTRISDESVNKVNNKLKEDGYPFRLKIIRIESNYDTDYIGELDLCGADIVFTGIGVLNSSDSLTIDEIISGKYEDLTEYIENSCLNDIIPRKLLDASSYKGKMYLLPSEYVQDGADEILIYKSNNNANAVTFDGIDSDVFMLKEVVSEKNKLFYGFTDFEFVRCFGYCYDSGNGLVISNEVQIINPFEDEKCLGWMQMVNTWYKEGMAPDPRDGNPTVIKAKCSLQLTTSSNITKEN